MNGNGNGRSKGRYNIIAAFTDMENASEALRLLEDAGVSRDRISFLGRQGHEIVNTDEPKTDDSETLSDAAVGTVAGAASGGALGGVAGFLLGLSALTVPGVGPLLIGGIWGATLLGVIGGGSAGSLVGVITGAALSNDKDETYRTHLERGHPLVGVSTDDPDEYERALDIVNLSHPVSVDRYGEPVGQAR
jgi:hypothetical protein